jgi:hypothetical protein
MNGEDDDDETNQNETIHGTISSDTDDGVNDSLQSYNGEVQ